MKRRRALHVVDRRRVAGEGGALSGACVMRRVCREEHDRLAASGVGRMEGG